MLEHSAHHVVPADHPCLAGHFPGNPVVPAVVLLDCVARALAGALGRAVRITAIPAVKFLSPLRPGLFFAIDLRIDPDHASARFRVTLQGAELAQGRLEYAHDA